MRLIFAAASVALLAATACSVTPERVVAPPITPEGSVTIAFRTIEVREVSLPAYAEIDEIFVLGEDGVARSESGFRWGDDPTRAATLDLTRGLAALTRARIAAEPWPFDDYPAARLDVRIEQLIADLGAGLYRLSAQVYVADMEGYGRDRTRRFELTAALPEEVTPQSYAVARGQLMAELAKRIAEEALR